MSGLWWFVCLHRLPCILSRMQSTDACRLPHGKLTDLRLRGVASVQHRESPEDVARVPGVHRATIYSWLSQYRPWSGLSARWRVGCKRKLDAKAIAWVYHAVTQTDPRRFKFSVCAVDE